MINKLFNNNFTRFSLYFFLTLRESFLNRLAYCIYYQKIFWILWREALLYFQLIDYRKQSHYREADNRSVVQEIPCMHPKFHHRIRKIWTINWTRDIESTPLHRIPLRSILTLSSHMSSLLLWFLLFRICDYNFYAFIFPTRAVRPAHLKFLNFTSLKTRFFSWTIKLVSGIGIVEHIKR